MQTLDKHFSLFVVMCMFMAALAALIFFPTDAVTKAGIIALLTTLAGTAGGLAKASSDDRSQTKVEGASTVEVTNNDARQ